MNEHIKAMEEQITLLQSDVIFLRGEVKEKTH